MGPCNTSYTEVQRNNEIIEVVRSVTVCDGVNEKNLTTDVRHIKWRACRSRTNKESNMLRIGAEVTWGQTPALAET